MSQDVPPSPRGTLTANAVERAHDFVSALFMAVRTAQIHDSSNTAFRSAIERTVRAAENLYGTTGGFEVHTAHGSIFVNRALLRFHGGSHDAMQRLQQLFTDRKLGGSSMRTPPTHRGMQRLVTLLARGTSFEASEHEALLGVDIRLLGPQQIGSAGPVSVNRSLFAIHTYAKLALAYREHCALVAHRLASASEAPTLAPRIRVARVVQDLIELAGERLDLLLHLTMNRRGLQPEELSSVNGTVMSIALGAALQIHRNDLMDIAMVTFFLPLGPRLAPGEGLLESARRAAVLAYLIQTGGSGPSSYGRAMMTFEQTVQDIAGDRPHPFSRIVRAASTFARLISGYGNESGRPPPPLQVFHTLMRDASGRLDPDLVDLMLNLLRAFPADCPVVLESGVFGQVLRPNHERWDRPLVGLADGRRADLSRREAGQFTARIDATPRFRGTPMPAVAAGQRPAPVPPRSASPPSGLPSLTDLAREGASPLPSRTFTGERPPDRPPHSGDDPHPPALTLENERTLADAPLHLPGPDRLVGTYLAGRYRMLRKLGEGGMGAVYLARQEPIDRNVAVKILLSGLLKDRIAVARFEREAKTISKMRNPNTVTVFDYGKTQAGDLYIVMEYLAGRTLAEVIGYEGPLAPRRAAHIARQICGALAEAHDFGVVHRDLKPDNIILTRMAGVEDWVKVLDFGLAKLVDNEQAAGLTQHGRIFGTPRYMSPEQAQDFSLDGRSDLYALGVILYEMLTGRTPFNADNIVGILMKHVTEPPPPPSTVRNGLDLDPDLERLVLRMLAKNQADRFRDVRTLGAALRPFAERPPNQGDANQLERLIEDALWEVTPQPDTDEPMEF